VKYCENRNVSICEILGGVRAGDKDIDVTEQFHHIFWMGDMNYRLTFDTATPANTKKLLKTLNEEFEKNETAAVATIGTKDVTVELGNDPMGMDDDDGDEELEMPSMKALK